MPITREQIANFLANSADLEDMPPIGRYRAGAGAKEKKMATYLDKLKEVDGCLQMAERFPGSGDAATGAMALRRGVSLLAEVVKTVADQIGERIDGTPDENGERAMTVGRLIEFLGQFDKNAIVMAYDPTAGEVGVHGPEGDYMAITGATHSEGFVELQTDAD